MSKLLLPKGYRNAEKLQQRLNTEAENVWVNRGKNRALKLFHQMSERVPAYKDFLAKNKLSPKSIKSTNDFRKVPLINKNNYLKHYPKDMLCWDGEFTQGQWVISTTSGSTGQPYYFPRERSQDYQYALTAELYLRDNFNIQNHTTLYIVAFPMGAWIGGVFTYEALKILSEQNGYDLSIITPGIHKQEVINAVKQLGSFYEQIIIGAYAPFLKDILDDGERQGLNWSDYNLGFVFSAEAFTEKFRDYVFNKTGIKDFYKSTVNHYGTVDLGTMAHETPESILVRRHLVEHGQLDKLLPEKTKQPTLCQFIPELFYFEEEEQNLICSAYSGIPLLRYDLNDYGGVISRSELHAKLAKTGISVDDLLKQNKLFNKTWNLPFVYVYERNDFSVSYYAFQIYPDTIRRSLQADKYANSLTGKFTMIVDYDSKGRQKLNIHIETKPGNDKSGSLASDVTEYIHENLIKESSEYRETAHMVGEEVKPVIYLHEYEDVEYFRSGGKQQWVKK